MTCNPVLPGLDTLVENCLAPVAGKTVALVTNHTAKTVNGNAILDVFINTQAVQVACLLTPEHGLTGKDDCPITDGYDPLTGIRVISLYGPRVAPEAADLYGVDLIVYDIQDAGCRFYTYISTLLACMKSAAVHGVPMLVLDRPNPIGGLLTEGPLPDPDLLSFTACHPIPLRHGLTVGELAQLYNAELNLGVDLAVEPVRCLQRSMWWSDTQLPWTNPSPNLRSPAQALLYPGVALCEFTNLSVGRGTDTPFQIIGAPWLDGRVLARALNSNPTGVAAIPVKFIPTVNKYHGEQCGGVMFEILDRSVVHPVRLGLSVAQALLVHNPNEWIPEGLMTLLANRSVYEEVVNLKSLTEIEAAWQPSLSNFEERMAPHLLYH